MNKKFFGASGYDIIMTAYAYASAKNNKKFFCRVLHFGLFYRLYMQEKKSTESGGLTYEKNHCFNAGFGKLWTWKVFNLPFQTYGICKLSKKFDTSIIQYKALFSGVVELIPIIAKADDITYAPILIGYNTTFSPNIPQFNIYARLFVNDCQNSSCKIFAVVFIHCLVCIVNSNLAVLYISFFTCKK